MRKFVEPTARSLLRRPLVLGVPFPGLLLLTFGALSIFVAGAGRATANGLAIAVGAVGYLILRVFSRFAKPGWEESLIFALERMVPPKVPNGRLVVEPSHLTVSAPDTLTETDLLNLKDGFLDRVQSLRLGERWTALLRINEFGAEMHEVGVSGRFDLRNPLEQPILRELTSHRHIYSLYRLPVNSDPLWLFGLLSKTKEAVVIAGFQGIDPAGVKRQIEHARRSNSQGEMSLSDIDSMISFEEASLVLQGLSRGSDTVVEAALVIASSEPLDLDQGLFVEEKNRILAALSALGVRKRFHRSHLLRAVTACDLVPNIIDPRESGIAILRSVRGNPLYFSPQDPRLEALHWLVVGASGSGKSFFTGLVLKRMIDQGCPMSVLFMDHNRSFRRLVRGADDAYLEPKTLGDIEEAIDRLQRRWNQSGSLSGIELSDLDLVEKKAAIRRLLSGFETFLRNRDSIHPVYLVLDECWNFMRDEPVLVQRAFREYRKLNGAVIAITQSLSDFLTDESGQSIFQNAPIRVLLRQGEDVSRYQGILGLNSVELERVSRLRQKKGEFSESLIKTPFLSRLGRLCPSEEEHRLLRTDDLRAELIAEAKAKAKTIAKTGAKSTAKTGGMECAAISS